MKFEMINKYVRLDAETGRTYWEPRVPSDFGGEDADTQIHACKTWNTRFAGKECFNWFDTRKGEYTGSIFGKTMRRATIVFLLTYQQMPSHRIGFFDGDPLNTRPKNLYVKTRTRS